MCQCNRIADDPQTRKHRRLALLFAAFVAILGGLPSLLSHAHRPVWMAGIVIAVQILLLILAGRQISLARRRPIPGC